MDDKEGQLDQLYNVTSFWIEIFWQYLIILGDDQRPN